MKKKQTTPEPEPTVRSFETFLKFGSYEESCFRQDKPSSFNGIVTFRKYKVTIELLEEPIEVLRQRVQKLWDECDNHHHWEPLQAAAKSLGMERLEHK